IAVQLRVQESLLQSFRYGSAYLLSKLIRGQHIDKVLFAATKADHVPDISRDHWAELLRNMAAIPANEAKSSSARFDVIPVASVISTVEDTQEIGGQRVQVVYRRAGGGGRHPEIFVVT